MSNAAAFVGGLLRSPTKLALCASKDDIPDRTLISSAALGREMGLLPEHLDGTESAFKALRTDRCLFHGQQVPFSDVQTPRIALPVVDQPAPMSSLDALLEWPIPSSKAMGK